MTAARIAPLSFPRLAAGVLALALLYFATGRLGLTFAHFQDNATLVWPPSGIALSALLLFGRRLWPGIFLGALTVNLSMGTGPLASAGIATGNTLEALVGCFLLVQVWHFHPTLERVRDVAALLGAAALSCTVSALVGTTSLTATGIVPIADLPFVAWIWWLGDLGGVVVLTPLCLLMRIGSPSWRVLGRTREAWAILLGLGLGCFLAFGGRTPVSWSLLSALLAFTFLIWAGARLGPRGAMLASGLTAVSAVLGTAAGYGPFVTAELHTSLMLLWAYATTVGVAALMLAAAITEREHSERARLTELETRARLEHKIHEAQRVEGLGLLAGGFAHDFNNILTAISGNADLLRRQLSPGEDPDELLERIEQSSERAAELCRRLQAYAGQRQRDVKIVCLSELLEEALRLLDVAGRGRVEFRTSEPAARYAIAGDPTLLRQVFLNLILNALESKEGGRVRVTDGTARLSAGDLATLQTSAEPEPGAYRFVEVADEGSGMNEETVERMFEPFFTTKFEGRGLGLAAVLGIVLGHAGAIEVRSEQGEGTRIRIYLPMLGHLVPQRELADERLPRTARAGELVLVADDEPQVLRVVCAMLEEAGYRVLQAADGLEAVEQFRAHCDSIALCLLDVTMPRMDGVAALEQIHALSPEQPVILMSGYSREDLTPRLDYASLLRKPFPSDALLASVDAALEDREAEERAQ